MMSIHGKDVLLPYLYSLFNNIFASGHFPLAWSFSASLVIFRQPGHFPPA